MTKIYLLTDIVLVSAIIIICAISESNGVISDKRLCFDPECKEPVSLARTLIRYNSIEPHILSFPSNTEIVIFSKEAGRRKDLWGAEVRGKRGYVPKNLVREYKKLKSNLSHEVPTEFIEDEVKRTDKPKVEEKNEPNTQKDIEKVDVKVTGSIKESQDSNQIENLDAEVENGAKKESEFSKKPEKLQSETSGDDLRNPSHEKKSPELNAGNILESGHSVTPSFEVIDGTAIPLSNEEVPVKPSYSTPIITATATVDEEPILSVHPSLPSNVRPLLSRFSNSESRTTAKDDLKTGSDFSVENHRGDNDSERQFLPVQDEANDSENVTSKMEKENNIENDDKIENHSNNSLEGDIQAPQSAQPDESTTENSKTIVNSVENDKNEKVEPSENIVDTFVDVSQSDDGFPTENGAAGSSASDHQTKGLEKPKNNDENSEQEKVYSSSGEINDDVPQKDLENNTIHKEELESDHDKAEVTQGENELEGTIQEQEALNSQEKTGYLPDEKISDTREEVNEPDSFGERTVIEKTEIPLDSQTTHQHDDRVIVNDSFVDHDENSTVHNDDDSQTETEMKEHPKDNSQEEIQGNSHLFNFFNSASEEVSTEIHPDLEEERPTTTRSLLAVDDDLQNDYDRSTFETFNNNEPNETETQSLQEYENETYSEGDILTETQNIETIEQSTESTPFIGESNLQVAPNEACDINSDCADLDKHETSLNEETNAEEDKEEAEDGELYSTVFDQHNYLETLLYLSITAFTSLLYWLGYYYIENHRRDKELIAKINILEKELFVTTKESIMLSEGLKATKHKLDSIEDESFGSNEMVSSLKAELEAAQVTKGELEDQIISLEKELESATEAGLELERMLREFLASQSDENPLAQSVEDLQTRLNAQQATNESLTNSLNLKSQENEALTAELANVQERCQQLEVEVTRLYGELKTQTNFKQNTEKELSVKITQLNKQIGRLSEERASLVTQLASKEMALNDLSEVIKQQSTNDLDLEKLYDVSYVKAEAQLVVKERDELRSKITEVEGAHELLEEHMKLIKEEVASITEQYELAERDKIEAQTRLEVLSNYFKEKESQLQKELGMQEAMWVQKQGEVTSTVDRIQTMQNEIQNYRQQIETLKREILDQEREYKSQIAALETKSHEQWVIARQSERRLEESKAEASQLRNRLTMVEKSINEVDTDAKIHRLETNGETASSPQLFMGAETSSSPVLFTGSSGASPFRPPPYIYGAPLPPPFMPPPPHSGGGPMYDISRRPPPLGGRLSSPPPMPPLHHPPGRYEDSGSPPPPLSPPLHPPYNHRSPPPFSNERIHPHPHPLPPFFAPLGTSHSWGDEPPLPPLRNPVFHPNQREQRVRNHKGSLHSSGDSLDKTNHTGKS